MVITKFCKGCNTEKELNTINFKPNKARSNGWETKCRECINAYYREYSKNKPEWRREKERKYKEKNPEKLKIKVERRRIKIKENQLWKTWNIDMDKVRERDKKRAKTPARIAWQRARWEKRKENGYNEKAKALYDENPLTRRLNVNKRRIRVLGLKGSHTEKQLMEKYRYHGEACYYCKKPLMVKEMTVDHRIPVSRNGTDFIANIVPACGSCNSSKRDKTDKEFIQWLNKLYGR